MFFLCAYCHKSLAASSLEGAGIGEEPEPGVAPWISSFFIHTNSIWLEALLWVSHCPSTLGSLRPKGGKIQFLGRSSIWLGVGAESTLALEMALHPNPLSDTLDSSVCPQPLPKHSIKRKNHRGARIVRDVSNAELKYVRTPCLFSRHFSCYSKSSSMTVFRYLEQSS